MSLNFRAFRELSAGNRPALRVCSGRGTTLSSASGFVSKKAITTSRQHNLETGESPPLRNRTVPQMRARLARKNMSCALFFLNRSCFVFSISFNGLFRYNIFRKKCNVSLIAGIPTASVQSYVTYAPHTCSPGILSPHLHCARMLY